MDWRRRGKGRYAGVYWTHECDYADYVDDLFMHHPRCNDTVTGAFATGLLAAVVILLVFAIPVGLSLSAYSLVTKGRLP